MACFLAYPVQCVLNGRPVDQGIQRLVSTGDIKERNPDQDGKYALAGKKKHDEAGETQKVPKTVPDELDQQGDSGMALMSLFHNRGMNEKVIGGGPGNKKRDEQQAGQKGRH